MNMVSAHFPSPNSLKSKKSKLECIQEAINNHKPSLLIVRRGLVIHLLDLQPTHLPQKGNSGVAAAQGQKLVQINREKLKRNN